MYLLKTRISILFILLASIAFLLFVADLAWGSISIPLKSVISILSGQQTDAVFTEVLLNFRLPKALTAVLAGVSLSVAGLLMQTLFRNPLADPYILGVSSGAGLGVAVTMMASSLLPLAFVNSGWTLVVSAILGAVLVLVLVIAVSFKINNTVSLLIVGIMFGTIASSIVHVLQNFSNPDELKLFVLWTFGSLSAVTWNYMAVLAPIVFVGLLLAFALQKKLDGLLLGENYARGLGISIVRTRLLVVMATALLAGGVTAFTGPIAFVGVAIPHIARGVFRSSAHKVLLPACALLGGSLLLACDIIAQLPSYALPINTVSALFGAPIIVWIILKRK